MTLTRQEIFDKAWLGLKAQGFMQSLSEEDGCAYRGENGRKCAIGHCIPDDRYRPGLEGKYGYRIAVLRAANISTEDAGFVGKLQECHDLHVNPHNMQLALRLFARENSLTIPK